MRLFGEDDDDHDEEEGDAQPQHLVFVDMDSIGRHEDFDGTPTTDKPSHSRAKKALKTGTDPKGKDLLRIHPKSTRLEAADGVVMVNVYQSVSETIEE